MAECSRHGEWLLRLTLVEGIGPILGRRLIEEFGSPSAVFDTTPADLERVRGIAKAKARTIFHGLHESRDALEKELALAAQLGVSIVPLGSAGYPHLLAQTPDAPLVLFVRGNCPGAVTDYCVAIVGSRRCTAYGVEQTERFTTALVEAGLVVVSGGARGIDSACHAASVRAGGRTAAVLGCGLAHCYPPENADLFASIVEAGGCLISELPLNSPPAADNFPARNRIIAGMSLGTLVIEAPVGSGALITAQQAVEEYGREVMAVPGRIDSPASEGSNDLLKRGAAALVTKPSEVLEILEPLARKQHDGAAPDWLGGMTGARSALEVVTSHESGARDSPATPPLATASLSDTQRTIVEAVSQDALTVDAICRATGLDAGVIQAESTVLEIRRIVVRDGAGRIHRK